MTYFKLYSGKYFAYIHQTIFGQIIKRIILKLFFHQTTLYVSLQKIPAVSSPIHKFMGVAILLLEQMLR